MDFYYKMRQDEVINSQSQPFDKIWDILKKETCDIAFY